MESTQTSAAPLDPINANYKAQRNEAWSNGLDLFGAGDRLLALIKGKMAAGADLDLLDLAELEVQLETHRPFYTEAARYLGRE